MPGKHASMGWDVQGSLTAVWLSIPTNIDSLSPATGILGKAKSNLYHLPSPQESRQEMLARTAGINQVCKNFDGYNQNTVFQASVRLQRI